MTQIWPAVDNDAEIVAIAPCEPAPCHSQKAALGKRELALAKLRVLEFTGEAIKK
ncbi:hypothetical protein JQ636_40570 [Bradyrhizobium japonicum]|uniref:hypothetical protein n=1 Tax=Bradyrhizobium japonicum TaxID=375 RepID=UPI001BADC953|nr:hypothetical protein [Bradyrhizobium japonicum]MBR0731095.1 hypothetical protein [Bradyrhizobium japonicum]MBR0809853.1 hypothetical protein [Bradyrhizobium japonicum]